MRSRSYFLTWFVSLLCLVTLSTPWMAQTSQASTSKTGSTIAVTAHTKDAKPHHTSSGSSLQWPFSPADGSWNIESGYNDSNSPDHNCYSPNCYERYGFDFQAAGGTGGKTIYSPATSTGTVYIWDAAKQQGQPGGKCFTFSIGNNTFVMVCHVDFFNGVAPTSVTQGVPVGTVTPIANHIHISLFTSTSSDLSLRNPVPFSGPWTIGGCDYPNDPNNQLRAGGQYGGQPVPCANQGSTPILTFRWGDYTSPLWSGFNFQRPVFVEVRSNIDAPDLFSQSVTTDPTGTATLTLNNIVPGTCNVLIKPQGLLRQAQPSPVNLVAGTNNLTFSLTQSGTSCIDGQPTGQQIWGGDVDGNNVINSDDYTAIVSLYGQRVPPGYADFNGDGVFDGSDYNLWLRTICFFGGGSGVVVGDGGRSDSPIGQAQVHRNAQRKGHLPVSGPGTLSLSPASGTYRINQSFSVNVQANSAGLQLDGADIVVRYDPTVLKVTGLSASNIFASSPALTNDPSKGEINISSLANKGQPVIVSGTLATIQFQVIGSGQTPVTVDFNSSSNAHTTMAQDGSIAQVLGVVYSASYTAGMLFVPQNYATIGQALAAASPGETVFVSPGTYYELLTVPAGIFLEGQDPTTTIIDGSTTNNTAVIYIGNGAKISNLTVQHSGTNFWDAALWADQGPVTITNMRILNSSMGIVRYCGSPPCSDTSTITNNVIAHNINTGILIHGAQAQVQNNTVVDNHLQGITFESPGGQGTSSQNILASNLTGLTAPAPTTLVRNLLWNNNTTYGSGTTPSSSDIQANPLFINANLSNYYLHAVSAAIDVDGTLGAYVFTPVGTSPTHLTLTQKTQRVTLSWQTTGAVGYYVFIAQSSGLFSQAINVGNKTSYTFSVSGGLTQFAVTSYNAQGQESLATYLTTTIAGLTINPNSGSRGSSVTVTGVGFAPNESVKVKWDCTSFTCRSKTSLGTATTDSQGKFSLSVTIPVSTTIGKHTIGGIGVSSGKFASAVYSVTSVAPTKLTPSPPPIPTPIVTPTPCPHAKCSF